MVNRVRKHRWSLALALLVAASAITRFAVARTFTVPWITPDEMLYALIGRSLWLHGTLTVRNAPTPYYSLLYPALIGAPMLLKDTRRSIEVIQAMQAVVVSLSAVPVLLWARRLVAPRLALGAATLTVLVGTLAYSGLMMSETLFYPLSVVALIALARVLEEPTALRQGQFLLAVTVISAVRLQALVLLPTFLLAALLHAWFARSTSTLRRLAPFVGTGIVVVVVAIAWRLAFGPGLAWQDLLGAYGTLGATASSISVGHITTSVLWHAADVPVLTLGLPVLATVALVHGALRGRELDPAVQSFLAATSAYVVLLVCEVGAFAATHLGHVSERYLASAGPPLFIAYALWLERGGPRPRVLLLGFGGAIVALLALVPIRTLASPIAPYDGFSTVALSRLLQQGHTSIARVALLTSAVLALALFVPLPRRFLMVGLAALGAGLIALSVLASQEITCLALRAARGGWRRKPRWIDATDASNMTLLDTGDRPAPAVARTFFWNQSIADGLRLQGVPESFPPGSQAVTIADDGHMLDRRGARIVRHGVVAPSTLTFDGTSLAQLPAGTSTTYGLTLWRVDGPVRVTMALASGFLPNGDFINKARVVVYGCRRGRLEITLLGKSGAPIYSYVNGTSRKTFDLPSQAAVTERIPAPDYADGAHACTYDFVTTGLVGSTRVAYVPD